MKPGIHRLSFWTFPAILSLILSVVEFNIAFSQPFRVFAVSDLSAVFEDGFKMHAPADTLKIFGIRGEIISGQCVVNAFSDLENVTVGISPLKDDQGRTLPTGVAEWNFVGCVPLNSNARNQRPRDLVRQAPALFPDYLITEKSSRIKKGTFKSVWLSVSIPEECRAGSYSGTIEVKGNRGSKSLPVLLTVFPLNMPAERHLNVTEWYNTRNFSKFHGIDDPYSDQWFSMLGKYAQNMVDHRQNGFQIPINTIEIKQLNNGSLIFDFTRFDQIAQVFWDTKKMDFMETGNGLTRFGDGGVVNSTEVLLNDFNVVRSGTGEKIKIPGKDIIPYFLPAFEDHLKQKGWLHKTYLHVKDEPNLANSEAWREMSGYFHRYAPGLKRIDALATSHVIDKIEVAVPKLDKISPQYDVYQQFRCKGLEVWFYTVGIYQTNGYPNKTIDVPLMDSRILHWLNYRYGLKGYLHWGWNQWTDNPYEDVGMHLGDGWLVYPVKDGVINSLRWEQMRNGIQDYEYFCLLENRIRFLMDSLRIDHFRFDPAQRGKELTGYVIKSFSEYDHDPAHFYGVRHRIIRELMDLSRPPMLYVQTTPAEHSLILDKEVIEVIGFADPGAEVRVNGSVTKVSPEGIFLMRTQGSKKDLEVTAKSPRGETIARRHFQVAE